MQSRSPSRAARPRSGAPAGKPGTTGGAGAGAARKGSVAPLAMATGAAAAADELRTKAELLERGLKNEELARNYMQLERDKIQGFWDITRQELGDARAELRLKDRELEEAEDKHGLELKVYKQRVKHLLYEHQDGLSRLKAAGEAALKQQADAFAQQEAQLGDDKRRLKQHVREQELSAEELIKQFRLDNAKQASRLRQEFEAQARAIQGKYEAQLRALQQAAEAHYAADLADLEEVKSAHIADLMTRHEAAFKDMQAYYSQVTHANLDLIKALKDEVAEMKAAEAAKEKLVGDVVRENRQLAEPLAQAVQAADSLRQQVQGAERDRSLLAATKARLAAAEKQARAAAWELEVTQQRLERVEQERDELRHSFDAAVLQAQQRSALAHQALQRDSKQDVAEGSVSSGGSNWTMTMWDAALLTPLPDQDEELLEDEGAPEVEKQTAELTAAADTAEAPAAPAGKAPSTGLSPLAALLQAALGAQESAELAARDN
ncbi:hypothetical protein ABPG77_009981 [Micractinium sp. CCAP 211/92]